MNTDGSSTHELDLIYTGGIPWDVLGYISVDMTLREMVAGHISFENVMKCLRLAVSRHYQEQGNLVVSAHAWRYNAIQRYLGGAERELRSSGMKQATATHPDAICCALLEILCRSRFKDIRTIPNPAPDLSLFPNDVIAKAIALYNNGEYSPPILN